MDQLPRDRDRYYVVHEDMLPEALIKTVRTKEMLEQGKVSTVHEAVEQNGLSRSTFYKYKDGIFDWNELQSRSVVTISMHLPHRSGVLSVVLSLLAEQGGNVLTIHQTIPLQGMANVIITVDTSRMEISVMDWTEKLQKIEGVQHIRLLGT